MNFLSSDALADYLLELVDNGDVAVVQKDSVAVEWTRWEDPGDYPNNLAARPLPPRWYVEQVNGSLAVSFAVPRAWVTTTNGELCFKFDDEGPCGVVGFIEGNEELAAELAAEVMGAVHEAMDRPDGADDSLDEFRVAWHEAVAERAGHETRVTVEATVERV